VRYLLLLVALSLPLAGCGKPTADTSRRGGSSGGEREGVILLRYKQGSESTEQREEGFLEEMRTEYPDIPVLSSNQYPEKTTPESSADKSNLMLDKYGDRVAGVFSVCEPNATGMLEALEQHGLAGEVKFVGFDPTPRMVAAMSEGKMHGIVLQDPVKMGYLAVKTMVDHLDGKAVPKRIDTGTYLATPENMNTERMQQLLNPEQFGGEEFQPEETKYVIAVIPKGTTHDFWKSVHAGASNAARDLGNVEIRWDGTLSESDLEGQINIVQDFVTQKVDGICLAPQDSTVLIGPIQEAQDAGIPTVIFDSGLASEELKVSYVATDNFLGGRLAAKRLGRLLSNKPEIP